MKEKKDQFEQFIADSFEKLAKKEEENEQESSIQMPEGVRESIRARLDDEIKKLEEKKAYDHLSEEDRRALELGRKMLRQESEKTQGGEENADQEEGKEAPARKKWTGRKRLRVCLVLAAVLILVMAIGVTGLGGPERVIQMLTQEVGDREVEQIDSSDENLGIVEEDEEEAYQTLKNEFGTEIVRLIGNLQDVYFLDMAYDRTLQFAELNYYLRDKRVVFYINASFGDTSLGIDVEESVQDKHIVETEKCDILVSRYNSETDKSKYSARFSYEGLEYFLLAEVSQEEFENLLNSLYFWGE